LPTCASATGRLVVVPGVVLATAVVLDALVGLVLVGVVLFGALALLVVVLVHVAGLRLGVAAGLDLLVLVLAVRLCQSVGLSAGEADEELLCERMVDDLACGTIASASFPSKRGWGVCGGMWSGNEV